jgi:phenylacetate-CoA ligase
MAIINWAEENILLPAFDFLSGKSISRSLFFLLNSQHWSSDKILEYQEERLHNLIKHAYENVPFYHELFHDHHLLPSDIKTSSDLHKIPVISKNDLRKHSSEYYLAQNISNRKIILMNSSGSTGEPFTYYITPEAFSMNYACAIRGWYWMGYKLGDTFSKLSQNPRSAITKKLQDFFTRNHYIFIRDLKNEYLHDVIHQLNLVKPDYIRCYPDPLLFLSLLINQGHALHYTPRAINTTGNILTTDAREKIEKAFKAPVFDSYSCEGSAQFFESPGRETYFSSMEYAITEVIDNNNNPAGIGRHITTDLWNYAMPFIRYDTQDIIEKSIKNGPSGINLTGFSHIHGRDSDILITPSGKYLIVHTFTIFFEYFEEIIQFQVIQYEHDRIRVLLVVNDRYNKDTENAILSGLIDLLGKDIFIEIEKVTEIPLLPSGKRKFIIRDESIKLPF